MKKRLTALFLFLCLLLPLAAAAAAPTEKQVYDTLIALKKEFPEGMHYTNDDMYYSEVNWFYGYGCVGFALYLRDQAFGDTPFRTVPLKKFEGLKVGDILRVNNDCHSVIILKTEANSITIAEANYNSSVHWGRKMTKSEVLRTTDYVWTSYPEIKSLSAPEGLKVSSVSGGASLSWQKVSSASFYEIYRKTGSGKWKKIGTSEKASYKDTSAGTGKKISYRIKAVAKSDADLVYSAQSKAVALSSIPAPKKITVTAGKNGKITVKWKKASGADSYEIYVTAKKKAPGDSKKPTAATGKTKATVKKLKSGKTYYVYVRSVKGTGDSAERGPWSDPVAVKVK